MGPVDPTAVIRALPQLFPHWDKNSDFELNANKTGSLYQVNHIIFRWSDKKKNPVEYLSLPLWDVHKAVLLPVLLEAIKPIGYLRGYFPRVMLARMLPGAVIGEHIDGHTRGWIAHKIHLPLITNPMALFFVDGQTYLFE
jgi:hypothetical protein